VPTSTVSQRISELEERLGARLLQCTTRRLGVTDAGRIYYDHRIHILAEVEDAHRAVTNLQGRPRGLPPMTVPASPRVSSPVLATFRAGCSEVQLEVLSRTGTWTWSKNPSPSPPAVAIYRRR
jgi:LysR family transcriptional regulator, regulator for bpeEF and oprC